MQQHSSVTHKIHARDFFLKGLCTVVLMRWLSRQRPLPPSLTPWGWSPGSTRYKAEPTSTSCPLTLRVCHGAHTYTCMHTLACTHMNSILFEIEAVFHSWKSMHFIFTHSLFQPPNDTFLAAELIHLSYELFSDFAVFVGSSAAPQSLGNHSCHPQKKALISHASTIAISLSL